MDLPLLLAAPFSLLSESSEGRPRIELLDVHCDAGRLRSRILKDIVYRIVSVRLLHGVEHDFMCRAGFR